MSGSKKSYYVSKKEAEKILKKDAKQYPGITFKYGTWVYCGKCGRIHKENRCRQYM